MADGFEAVMLQVALQQAPHPTLEAPVAGLVVALPQPGEDAKDARVALRGERPIGLLEPFVGAARGDIAVDHLALDFGRNIAPRILEYRSGGGGRGAGGAR